MPIYDVECVKCGNRWEQYIATSTNIPQCSCGGFTKRLIGPCNYKMKGQFTQKKEEPTNRVELDTFLSNYGKAPLFSTPEHKAKAQWALDKARTGNMDAKI